MLGSGRNTPKGKVQDLVDEILEDIEHRTVCDRLSAAAAIRKQVMALAIITDVWRSWAGNVALLDLLSPEDLDKMVKDFSTVLLTIAPPSAHFSDIIEEWDKKNMALCEEDSSGGINPV